ncbi:hypothetical protein PUNSTDRAFT_139084 [Punctularia strigosozonata HHB-11173 SS5]|uniref:Uncharacterized protein n=1 Tax=Punctularia strigosozonata (strain HHB-11173) TaxID=741275 RepID=R7S1E2_PUNST|nr:uncharacterized protein PUNSTDRAFT_139084 [Punctularia strigosozonata HHB-11173 SS5]EIN04043.1 hypothetical protein PUNSTDRAFT_139084 [Punctularia strigosozonata HHB-11173 SS5]
MRSEDFSDDHSTYEEYYVSDFSVPLNDISISNSSSQPNSRPTANKQSRLSRVFGAYLSDPLPVSEEYADRHRYPDHVIADERYPSDTDNRQTLSASIPSPGSYGNGLGNAQGRSVRYAALAFLGEYSEHGSSEVSRPRDRSSGPSGAEAPGKRVEWGMHWEKSRSPPSSASAGYVLTSDLNTSALPYRPQQFSPTYFRDPDRPQCLPSGEREVSSGLTSPPTYRDVSSRSREDTTGPSSPYLVSSVKSLDHNDAHRNIIVDILESPDPWASISELLGTTRRTGLPRSPRRYPNELDVVNGNSRRGVGYRSPRHYEESSDLGIAHKPGPLVLEPVRAKVPEPIPTLSPIPAGPYPEDELNWDLSSPMPGSQAYVVAPDYMRSPDILDLSWMDDSQADVSDILAMWRSGSVEDLDFLADHTTTEDLSVPLPLQDPGLANTGPTIQPAPGDEVVALRSPPATTQLDPRTSSPPAAGRFPLDDPIPLAQDSPMAPILSAPLIAVLQEHRHSPPITFTQESRTPSHRNPVCSGIAPFEGVYEAFDETHKQNVEGSHPDDSQQQVEDEVFQGPCLFFDEMDDREED